MDLEPQETILPLEDTIVTELLDLTQERTVVSTVVQRAKPLAV